MLSVVTFIFTIFVTSIQNRKYIKNFQFLFSSKTQFCLIIKNKFLENKNFNQISLNFSENRIYLSSF